MASTSGAVKALDSKGKLRVQQVKVERYQAGKVPSFAEAQDEEFLHEKIETKSQEQSISIPSVIEISTAPSEPDNVRRKVPAEKPLRKSRQELKEEALKRIHQEKEEYLAVDRIDLSVEKKDQSDSEDEEEEEEEIMLKPVFIPKNARETILLQEERQREMEKFEEVKKKLLEEKKQESRVMVAQILSREKDSKTIINQDVNSIDDTDGLDEEEETEAWKLRELYRIKRDREEREKFLMEREEVERIRMMSEEEREKFLQDKQREYEKNNPKGQYRFLQKYYHKGAFFLDRDESVLKRDYTEATEGDAHHKELLPKVMQVRDFGKSSRSKWTHLTAEDTTVWDAGWTAETAASARIVSKMGGIHDSVDKPFKKKKT